MPRDQKVGLALGVLLVGAVAALFFRNEPPARPDAPRLRNAASLDVEIAEKDASPYLPAVAATGKVNHTAAKPVSDGPMLLAPELESSDSSAGGPRLDLSDEDPFANAAPPAVTSSGPAPDPIQLTVPLPTADATAAPQTAGPANSRFHIVQRGDSLSSIAAKYLGSQGRFQDIYAANREQLKDANDLQVGMKLIIPDTTPRVETASPAPFAADREPETKSDALKTPAVPAADPASGQERKKFVPYRRSPLNRSTSLLEPTDSELAGRRLTQLPPEASDLIAR